MRWKEKPYKLKKKPRVGQIRVKKWFAIFPVKIGKETRWLEKISVKQVYISENYHNAIGDLQISYEWENVAFID